MLTSRQQAGAQAEQKVAAQLTQQGFTIAAYNYRTRSGEIDIIATNKHLVVFVEVKMRTRSLFDLAEVITISKQKKITCAALHYVAHQPDIADKSWRFDVALVEQDQITYIENAFTAVNK
jgi:putative endonuclease